MLSTRRTVWFWAAHARLAMHPWPQLTTCNERATERDNERVITHKRPISYARSRRSALLRNILLIKYAAAFPSNGYFLPCNKVSPRRSFRPLPSPGGAWPNPTAALSHCSRLATSGHVSAKAHRGLTTICCDASSLSQFVAGVVDRTWTPRKVKFRESACGSWVTDEVLGIIHGSCIQVASATGRTQVYSLFLFFLRLSKIYHKVRVLKRR